MRLAVFLALAVLSTNARAAGASLTMLRDAAVFHDDQRIKLLIHKEVQAERQGDYHALNQAVSALGKATDPLARNTSSH